MRTVAIESPFNGTPAERARNVRYAAWCLRDARERGEAPYAGHLLGPLSSDEGEQWRAQGLECDRAFREQCDVVAFYLDLGWSPGMASGLVAGPAPKTSIRMLHPDAFSAFERGEWPPGATMQQIAVTAPDAPIPSPDAPARVDVAPASAGATAWGSR